MKIYRRVAALAIMTTLSGIAGGAEIIGAGPAEFEGRCAVCHGLQGRGDGPFAALVALAAVTGALRARRRREAAAG